MMKLFEDPITPSSPPFLTRSISNPNFQHNTTRPLSIPEHKKISNFHRYGNIISPTTPPSGHHNHFFHHRLFIKPPINPNSIQTPPSTPYDDESPSIQTPSKHQPKLHLFPKSMSHPTLNNANDSIQTKHAFLRFPISKPSPSMVATSSLIFNKHNKSRAVPHKILKNMKISLNSVKTMFRPIHPVLHTNSTIYYPTDDTLSSEDNTEPSDFEMDEDTNNTQSNVTKRNMTPTRFPSIPRNTSYPNLYNDQQDTEKEDTDNEDAMTIITTCSTATAYTNLNTTPTTDYATFRLFYGTEMSPFAVRKSSFEQLRKKKSRNGYRRIRKRKKRDIVFEEESERDREYEETQLSFLGMPQIPQMSKYQTIFTIVNVYVNNTMLFNSYALMRGGLFAVFVCGMICIWLCYSSKLMVHLFSKVPSSYHTFPGVALQSVGYIGCFITALVIILENVGRTIICLISMWDNLLYLIKFDGGDTVLNPNLISSDHELLIYIAAISSVCLLIPTVWMLFFSELIIDSILGFISTSLLSIIIIINFILKFIYTDGVSDGSNGESIHFLPANIEGFVLCVGIFTSNLAGHACLPAIYSQMRDQKEYNFALNVSWIIIFMIQMITGIFGYITYGQNTKVLITECMMETSLQNEQNYGGYFWFRILPNLLFVVMIINLFVHVPIGVCIASTIPENALLFTHHIIKRVFRAIFFMIIVYIAWLVLDHIAILSAMMGSILTVTISLLCPLTFKLFLDYKSQTKLLLNIETIVILAIIFIFISLSGFMLYVDVK